MVFTAETIEALSAGFRKNEKYLNGFKKQADFGSADYQQYSGVFLDLNMYDDASSYQENYNYFGSRGNYDDNGGKWLVGTTALSPVIDAAFPNDRYPCFGQQRDGSPNTGKQLEGIWVQSYWRDDFLVQNIGTDAPAKPADGIDYAQMLGELTVGENYDGNFSLPDPNDANSGVQMFRHNQPFPGGGTNTYLDLIQLAKDNNIAAIPVYNLAAGNVFNNGVPYIAFVSALDVAPPTTLVGDDYDFTLGVPPQAGWDFNKSISEQKWFLSKFNCQYGAQFGFDNSFTRNKAVIFTNLQETRELDPKDAINYAGVGMIGAVNPAVKYDPEAARFEIEGLNTGMTIGNGNLQQPVLELEASDDPEQLCYNVGTIGNIQPFFDNAFYNDSSQNGLFPYGKQGYFPCLDMRQESSSIIASQSGVSILDINLFFGDNLVETASEQEEDSVNMSSVELADQFYTGSLLDKMGFNVTQLLPRIGSSQSFFTNNLEFRGTQGTYAEAYQNSLPMTTGQYISSAEIQASSLNSVDMPQYDLGINFFRQARPDVSPASITAFTIPDKLNYPYLCIYSDIATAGADTSYYGGVDSHSKIPCMAFMTRNYTNGDYFYALESTFNYTATKPFVITDITTDIRLPDGSRPVLDPNSAVIYKIQKSATLPAISAQINSTLNIKEDERGKDNSRRREALRKAITQNR
jgi:hypothetical protein